MTAEWPEWPVFMSGQAELQHGILNIPRTRKLDKMHVVVLAILLEISEDSHDRLI